MSEAKVYDEARRVDAGNEVRVVMEPDDLDVRFTERLLPAAMNTRGQCHFGADRRI